MNWFLTIFRGTSPTTTEIKGVKVGSRVQTDRGRGVITHGSIGIKYDEGTVLRNKSGVIRRKNDRTVVCNLDKITLL